MGTTEPGRARPTFLKLRWTTTLGAVLAAFALGVSGAAAGAKVTIGTGSKGGVYILLGEAICSAIKSHAPDIACAAVPSGGSVDNVKGLVDGRFDIGIVQADVHYHAVKGQGIFTRTGPVTTLRSLFSAHREMLAVIARPNTGIADLAGLPGHSIDIGPDGSGSNTTIKMLAAMSHWAPTSFKRLEMLAPQAQAANFCAGKVDIFTYVAGHPNQLVKDVLTKCPSRLVAIDGPAVDDLIKHYPYYVRGRIPADAYEGVKEDVATVGMLATVMTTTRLDEKVGYAVTKAVFDDLANFPDYSPIFLYLYPTDMVQYGLTAPFEAGAERYYRDTGRIK